MSLMKKSLHALSLGVLTLLCLVPAHAGSWSDTYVSYDGTYLSGSPLQTAIGSGYGLGSYFKGEAVAVQGSGPDPSDAGSDSYTDLYWYYMPDDGEDASYLLNTPRDIDWEYLADANSDDEGAAYPFSFDNYFLPPNFSATDYFDEFDTPGVTSDYYVAASFLLRGHAEADVKYGPFPVAGVVSGNVYYCTLHMVGACDSQAPYSPNTPGRHFASDVTDEAVIEDPSSGNTPTLQFPVPVPPAPAPTIPTTVGGNPILYPNNPSPVKGLIDDVDGNAVTSGVTWTVSGNTSKVSFATTSDDGFTVQRVSGDTSEGQVVVKGIWARPDGSYLERDEVIELAGTYSINPCDYTASNPYAPIASPYTLTYAAGNSCNFESTLDGADVYGGYLYSGTWGYEDDGTSAGLHNFNVNAYYCNVQRNSTPGSGMMTVIGYYTSPLTGISYVQTFDIDLE